MTDRDISNRAAIQEFATTVVPVFRENNAWETLAWFALNKLTPEALAELTKDYEDGLIEVVPSDEWSSSSPGL